MRRAPRAILILLIVIVVLALFFRMLSRGQKPVRLARVTGEAVATMNLGRTCGEL